MELLWALDDPAQVALDDALRDIAAPGNPPADMDHTKKLAWESIAAGKSINVVIGPPGVGKTYLISNLVKSILALTCAARVLISAQNHETLVQMEDELKKTLPAQTSIVVRVERPSVDEKTSVLREASVAILRSTSNIRADGKGILAGQHYQIKQTLDPVDDAERAVADRVFRDTDNLLLRSSDVTRYRIIVCHRGNDRRWRSIRLGDHRGGRACEWRRANWPSPARQPTGDGRGS